MNIKPVLRHLLILGLITPLAGCADEQDNLQAFVNEVLAQPAPAIEPIPEIRGYNAYIYASDGYREPFKPILKTSAGNGHSNTALRPDLDRPLDPLEAFPLDSLEMVGTMNAQGMLYALIQAPDDIVYRAVIGEHAGHDYGEITTITSDYIELTEIIPDGAGGYISHPTSIPLSQ
ncbi:MAG TPA: pilus assembly protein PilP [Salinisphaeraceae bacterium]|nr:pilus assembly protein PilP [Salinisphaeraceae bacterium]